MCSSISWQQFILTIVTILCLYYLYVGVSYFRKDWWYRLRTKKSPILSARPVVTPAMPGAPPTPNPLLPQVYDLVDEIRALLQGMGEGVNKVQLMDRLKALLQKYPALKDTAFQPSINQSISAESKNQCSVDFDEDEIPGCW